jgi:hypothetical protein
MPVTAEQYEQIREQERERLLSTGATLSPIELARARGRAQIAREEQPIISGASSLEKFLDAINLPQQALFGILNQRPEETFIQAGVRGTRENLRFQDVLERNRLAEGPAAQALGFAGDILFDPALLVAGPAFRLAGKGIGLTTRLGIGAGKRLLGPTISDKLFESAIKPIAQRFSKTAFRTPVEKDFLNLVDFEIGKFQNIRSKILLEEGEVRQLAINIAEKAGISADEILPLIAKRVEVKTGAQLAFPFGSLEESRKITKSKQVPLFVSNSVESEFTKIDDVLKVAATEEKLAKIAPEVERSIGQEVSSIKARQENIIMKEKMFGLKIERLDDSTVDYLLHLTTPEARQILVKLPEFQRLGRRFRGTHASQLKRKLTEENLPSIRQLVAEGGKPDAETLNIMWREGRLIPGLGPQGSNLFITDPFALSAVRRIRGEKAIADARVFIKAAGNPKMAVARGSEPSHFRKLALPDDPRMGALRNLTDKVRFDPDVAGHLEQMVQRTILPEGLDVFLKTFDSIQGIWKGITLAPFPAFHLRNAAGNFWNNYLSGMGPESLVHYRSARNFQRGRLGNLTLAGKSYQIDELTRLIDDFGVSGRSIRNLGQLDQRGIRSLQQGFNLDDVPVVGRPLGRVVQFGFEKVGLPIENNARIAHFFHKLDKGMEPMDAALSVKKYLFDYANGLTDFEQTVMRRIMPFYTWSRFNIPLQAQALVHNPRPFVRLSEIVNTVRQKGFPVGAGEGFEERVSKLRAEDRELLPDFIKEAIGIPFRLAPSGDPEYFLLGSWLPAADLEVLSGPGRFFEKLEQLVSPLIKEPGEQVFNYDTFLDRKIEQFPGQKAKFLGVSVRRRMAKSMRNIRLLADADRLMRSIQREPEGFTADQISGWGRVTRFIFGLKTFEVSPERGARRLLFQRRENIRRLRSAARRGDEANVRTLREIIERNR